MLFYLSTGDLPTSIIAHSIADRLSIISAIKTSFSKTYKV